MTTKKIYNSWADIEGHCHELLRQIGQDGWRPDYVVGLTRGGLVPANLISQYLGCRMETLKVSLRDGEQCESNCWMAEDAFGYVPAKDNDTRFSSDASQRKNILIVDDINDTGATINWIMDDWQGLCLREDPSWKDIWNNNVRVAVLFDNESSKNNIPIAYSAVTINKAAEDCWIVFPWEEWWK